MKSTNIFYLLTASALLFTACEKDQEELENPIVADVEEVFTTMRLTLTHFRQLDTAIFEFKDLDGDGGASPVIKNDSLLANSTYTMHVEFLNESGSSAEDLTKEVREEGDEHQIFFTPSDSLIITHEYADNDVNNNPIGLLNAIYTEEASQGDLKVTLKHQPNKNDKNVSSNTPELAGGETDIEVTFHVVVQ